VLSRRNSACRRDHRYWLTLVETGFFHAAHQLGGIHSVCLRKPNDRSEGRTLYTAFNGAQLSSVYAELDIDIELGKSCLLSNLSQHISEGLFRT
jgi:hypothetical protein